MSKQNIKLPLKYFPIQCFTHYAVWNTPSVVIKVVDFFCKCEKCSTQSEAPPHHKMQEVKFAEVVSPM